MNRLMVEKMPVSRFCILPSSEGKVCSTSESFLLVLAVRADGVALRSWDALRTLSLIVPKVTCKTGKYKTSSSTVKKVQSSTMHICINFNTTTLITLNARYSGCWEIPFRKSVMATQGKQSDLFPAAVDKKGLHSTLLPVFKSATKRGGNRHPINGDLCQRKLLKTVMG